jgi:hypothetical protein
MALAAATMLSGLFGIVMRSPITPVCRVGVPCSAPAAGVTLTFVRGGAKVASVVTTSTGAYRVRLAPGSYTVRVSPALKIGSLAPSIVTVPRGVAVRRNFAIDTGIR